MATIVKVIGGDGGMSDVLDRRKRFVILKILNLEGRKK